MVEFRALSEKEISELEIQHCNCSDWNKVKVSKDFSPRNISNTSFSGEIYLGTFNKIFQFPGGVQKRSGISNATIHNCTIESDVYINQVKNHIANYIIKSNVVIENVDSITTIGNSYFGNDIEVSALNEAGGREISIFNELSAHTAYILALYRHRPKLIKKLQQLICNYREKIYSSKGTIETGAQLINCSTIIDTNIGKYATIDGIYRLKNGTINSSQLAPSYYGPGVIAENFISASGSTVTDAALVNSCFIGQGCELSKQYSAENSVFFANSQAFHGEACSIFAGPYTVTHHKSTLLIAGYFSFMNAGSGSNQSNHMYKLGPLHQGILERGSKTTSDSYILWPARIGAFSLVMGRHYCNPDTSNLPFSYLIESNNDSILVPAINLRSVGTIRDARKWPTRDKRKDKKLLDFINYNLLSPFTIQKMIAGKKILENLQNIDNQTSEYLTYNHIKITPSSIERGIKLYNIGITKFLGNALIKKLEEITFVDTDELRQHLGSTSSYGEGEWIDMAGLLVPSEKSETLLDDIENGIIKDINSLNASFEIMHQNYFEFAWNWSIKVFNEEFGIDMKTVSIDQLLDFSEQWIKSVVELDNMLYADAHKEFKLENQTGFGIDGSDETLSLDFIHVRGEFEKHPTVIDISKHIEDKRKLANELQEKLIQCKVHTNNLRN